jgi:hypothetical protein
MMNVPLFLNDQDNNPLLTKKEQGLNRTLMYLPSRTFSVLRDQGRIFFEQTSSFQQCI